jgi:transcriptional regulator with PAS, ATPase and Fis domain
LRERREDVPVLANYFLQKYRERYKSTVEELPTQLLDAFYRYDWPGNVRQLENAVKRFLILPDITMTLAELREPAHAVAAAAVVSFVPPASAPKDDRMSLKDVGSRAAEQAEKELVLRVLEETAWNRKQAARRLNICYKALLNKLKRWQIDNRHGMAGLVRRPEENGTAQPKSA